jgi:hypothetical protein
MPGGIRRAMRGARRIHSPGVFAAANHRNQDGYPPRTTIAPHNRPVDSSGSLDGDVSLRGAARADWRDDSGINQAPTCQVAHCGRNRERLGRHRRGGCRGGRSVTDRDRQRKPDDYRRNRHDDDAAGSATDGEGQPGREGGSSQRLLRPNARGVAGPTRLLFRRMSAFGTRPLRHR